MKCRFGFRWQWAGLVSVLSAFSVPSANAQTDPRLVDVIRDAQEGQGDSARAKVQRLLASTSPADTLYPQILYTQAMVASDAGDMRRQLQRVAVEYSTSSWADDALLRLVQLDYASANLEGAARNLERIYRDYPGTPLLPQASYWAARTYFDQKNPAMACRWLADGLSLSRGNVELQNQLGYLNQRCAGVRVDSGPPAPADTQRAVAVAPPAADTTRARPDSAPRPRTPTPAPAAPPVAPPQRTDTAAAPRPTPRPTLPGQTAAGRYRIQITAVRSQATANSTATKLRARGLDPMVVQEAGLFKVRVGNYASKQDAIAALPEVKAKVGGSPFVVAEP